MRCWREISRPSVLGASSQRLRRIWFVAQKMPMCKANTNSKLQWPENYNWESTRAINTPTPQRDVNDTLKASNEALSSKEKMAYEAKDGDDPFDTAEDDLDPVALKKAFRFAAISSVTLVSNFAQSCVTSQIDACSLFVVRRVDSSHSAPIILRADNLHCAWSSGLGLNRNCMGVVLTHCGRHISTV